MSRIVFRTSGGLAGSAFCPGTFADRVLCTFSASPDSIGPCSYSSFLLTAPFSLCPLVLRSSPCGVNLLGGTRWILVALDGLGGTGSMASEIPTPVYIYSLQRFYFALARVLLLCTFTLPVLRSLLTALCARTALTFTRVLPLLHSGARTAPAFPLYSYCTELSPQHVLHSLPHCTQATHTART